MEHFADYILLEKISSGGMADIYKAARLGSSGFFKLLAIKRIKPHIARDKSFQQMFIKEAHVQSSLSHPNVVNIFDFGREGDDYYIAMEYLNGVPLRTLLQMLRYRHEQLRLELIFYISRSLLTGLDYIHNLVGPDGTSSTIIHRDLDPRNVFLTFTGEIKLLDFGIADTDVDTIAGQNREEEQLKGKFSYFAPELIDGHSANVRTDLFSAGLLFYEMFSLEKLFAAESSQEVLSNVLSLDIEAKIKELSCDQELKKILCRSLERDPDQRYQSAADFSNDLRLYQQQHQLQNGQEIFPGLMDHLFQEEQQAEYKKNQFYFSILKDRDAVDEDQTNILNRDELEQQINSLPDVEEKISETPELPDIHGQSLSSQIKKYLAQVPVPLLVAAVCLILAMSLLILKIVTEKPSDPAILKENNETVVSVAQESPPDRPAVIQQPVQNSAPAVMDNDVDNDTEDDVLATAKQVPDNPADSDLADNDMAANNLADNDTADNDTQSKEEPSADNDLASHEPKLETVPITSPVDQSRISVQGKPSGQTVFLDGLELGELPIIIMAGPGFHSVKCRKEGYQPQEVRVRAINDQTVTVDCVLDKNPSTPDPEPKQ